MICTMLLGLFTNQGSTVDQAHLNAMVDQARRLIEASGSDRTGEALADLTNFASRLETRDGMHAVAIRGFSFRFDSVNRQFRSMSIEQPKVTVADPVAESELVTVARRLVDAVHQTGSQSLIEVKQSPASSSVFMLPKFGDRVSTQSCSVYFVPGTARPRSFRSFERVDYTSHGNAQVVSENVAREVATSAYLRGRPFPAGRLHTLSLRVGLPTTNLPGYTLSEMTPQDKQNISNLTAIPLYIASFVPAQSPGDLAAAGTIQRVAIDARDGRPLLMLEIVVLKSEAKAKWRFPELVRPFGTQTEGKMLTSESKPTGKGKPVAFASGDTLIAGTLDDVGLFTLADGTASFKLEDKLLAAARNSVAALSKPFGANGR